MNSESLRSWSLVDDKPDTILMSSIELCDSWQTESLLLEGHLTGHFGSLIGVNESVRFIELSLSFDFGGIFTVFSPIIPSQDDVLQKVMPHFGMQLARTVAHLAIMRATGMWCRVEVDYDVGSQGFLSLNDFGVIPH